MDPIFINNCSDYHSNDHSPPAATHMFGTKQWYLTCIETIQSGIQIEIIFHLLILITK